jgi:hypothetical protein
MAEGVLLFLHLGGAPRDEYVVPKEVQRCKNTLDRRKGYLSSSLDGGGGGPRPGAGAGEGVG